MVLNNNVSISINNQEVDKLLKNIDKFDQRTQNGINDHIALTALNIQRKSINKWKGTLKTTTRRLETSLRIIYNRALFMATVFTDYFVAPFIEFGTKPHEIKAKNKKALKFYYGRVHATAFVPAAGGFKTHFSGGNLWIGKGKVDHPGTKENPAIREAVKSEQNNYISGIKRLLNK